MFIGQYLLTAVRKHRNCWIKKKQQQQWDGSIANEPNFYKQQLTHKHIVPVIQFQENLQLTKNLEPQNTL